MNSNKSDLNQSVLNKLKASIFIQEKNNIKTKKKSDTEIV